jgi:hypothetical protein
MYPIFAEPEDPWQEKETGSGTLFNLLLMKIQNYSG